MGLQTADPISKALGQSHQKAIEICFCRPVTSQRQPNKENRQPTTLFFNKRENIILGVLVWDVPLLDVLMPNDPSLDVLQRDARHCFGYHNPRQQAIAMRLSAPIQVHCLLFSSNGSFRAK